MAAHVDPPSTLSDLLAWLDKTYDTWALEKNPHKLMNMKLVDYAHHIFRLRGTTSEAMRNHEGNMWRIRVWDGPDNVICDYHSRNPIVALGRIYRDYHELDTRHKDDR